MKDMWIWKKYYGKEINSNPIEVYIDEIRDKRTKAVKEIFEKDIC